MAPNNAQYVHYESSIALTVSSFSLIGFLLRVLIAADGICGCGTTLINVQEGGGKCCLV